ncbi:efflux RND transporter periplasmic adaptor subunit [Sphingomonas sp. GB1N7]|uniref:efflux RND transporter periplasmic adaptor subunit n=1 Tax=Parasphingomonas caseinilytica TaxID=3096158 RepID=UPI002FCC09DE
MKAIPLLVLLTCTACSGGATDEAAPAPVALVSLARVESGTLGQHASVYGIAEGGPASKAVLTAPAEAIVTRIVAPAGTRVTAGEVIAQLSATPATRLDIAKAASDARAADAALARVQRLRADGLTSDAEVETARAAAAAADATRASLSGRAGALTLRAPAAGFVESVATNPGDTIQSGAVVATIARGGNLRARFGVDPATARTVRAGTPLAIAGSAGRAGFTVPVQSVEPVVDPVTKLAAVFAKLPAQAGIGVGEALTGSILIGATGNALTIPYAALLDDGGQPYVFVVANGVAHRRDVAIGATERDRVAVTKGLSAGDAVVTAGGTAVQDGMKVRTR